MSSRANGVERLERKSASSNGGDESDAVMMELMASTSHLFAPLPAAAQADAAVLESESVPRVRAEAEEYYGTRFGKEQARNWAQRRRPSSNDRPAFVQRLEQWEKKRNERLQHQRAEKEKESSVDPECTFSPHRFRSKVRPSLSLPLGRKDTYIACIATSLFSFITRMCAV